MWVNYLQRGFKQLASAGSAYLGDASSVALNVVLAVQPSESVVDEPVALRHHGNL